MAEPKIRFSKFGDKWNEIPLNNFLYENKDRNKDEKFTKEDVLSVSGEYGVVNQIALQGRSFAGESVAPYHVVNTGDVIYTKSPLKANPYGIIKYNSGVPGIVSTLYAVYHCKNNVDGKFVELYFSNDYRLNKYLKPLVNIGAKHDMKVSNEHAISGLVTFPSLEEQKAIVLTFSAVEDIISTITEEVRLWEEKKKGVMQKIFSQEVRFKDKNGEDFPEWENLAISDCTEFVKDGTHGTHKDVQSNHPLLSAKDIYDGVVHIPEDARTISDNDYNSIYSKYSLELGDVLVTIVGTLGRTAIISDACIHVAFQRSVGILRPNRKISSLYLKYVMDNTAFQNELERRKSKGAQAGVYLGTLSEIVIGVPTAEEQQKIADCLSSIDEVIAIKKQKLDTWKNIKKGLLQQMFV